MRRLATLAALALLFPSLANGIPDPSRTNLPDNGFEYTITFPAADTDDSKAMRVRGMCSVTWVRGGSDVVELYSVPTATTAATSGTLLGTFTTSSTAATTFQSGTRWVRAVATTAATGGSLMRIHCSNSQVASTGEACTAAGLAPYVGDLGGYKCESTYSYDEDEDQLTVGEVAVTAVAGKNVIRMEANSAFTGDDPTSTEVLLYGLTGDTELYVENLDGIGAPSRVVTDSPDYYDVVLSWAVDMNDIDNQYATLTAGATTTQKFCMVKAAGSQLAQTIATSERRSLRNTAYKWTASGSGTDEWHVELAAGGDPTLHSPTAVYEDALSANTSMPAGSLGSLSAGDHGYGDNDTLGYDTIYVRLTATGDPDLQAVGFIEAVGSTAVTIPLTGSNGCTAGSPATQASQAFTFMGDPYIKDAWCTTHPDLDNIWVSGDEIVVRFGVSNAGDMVGAAEWLVSVLDMTYGYDEIDNYKEIVGRHTELRTAIGALSSSFFAGAINAGGLKMTIFTASIESMTVAVASDPPWTAARIQCSLGLLFRDTR